MSKAEELLNSLPEEEVIPYAADPSTEPHIVVNADRTITVPDELKKIAVQYDHNVKTVTFDCPRYWDGRDLSTMVIYVNYLTSGNKVEPCPAENITIDGTDTSIIHFDWTITKNATRTNGTLAFLVCAKKTDSDGYEENHWNSELNKEMYVSEGLESDAESILEQYPDLVTHILLLLGDPKALESLDSIVASTVANNLPECGVDYWTSEEQAAVKNEVLTHTEAYVASWAPTTVLVTLALADWADSQQIVTVEGVTTDNIVIVSPEPEDYNNYNTYVESGIRCVDQRKDQLKFKCVNTPAVDIAVNVVIQYSSTEVETADKITVTDDGDGNVLIS